MTDTATKTPVQAPEITGEYSKDRSQFLADVITTAVEGGIGYWSTVSAYRWYSPRYSGPDHGSAEPAPGGAANAWTIVHQLNDDESGYVEVGVPVGLDQIEAALGRILQALAGHDDKISLASDYLKRITIASLTNDAGEIDALDADAVVQIAVLGEVVYG